MPSRRRFLAAVGAASLGALAGCAATTDDPPAPTDPTLDPDRHVFGADGEWSSVGCNAANNREVADGKAPVDGVAVQWRTEVGGLLGQEPLVADGRVYLTGSGRGGEQLRVLDAADGTQRWTAGDVDALPLVRDDTVYAAGDGTVRALDVSDGTERWSQTVDGATTAPLAGYPGDSLLVGAGERVVALDPASGEEQWSRRLFGLVMGLAVSRGFWVIAATEAGKVYSLGPDGTGGWEWSLPARPTTPPVTDSDSVYVNCRDGVTYALGGDSTSLGETVWSVETGGATGGLAVVDGTVYAATGRSLRTIDAETGEPGWTHETGDWRITAPTVARDTLFVGGDRLWALDPTPRTAVLDDGPAVRFERSFAGRVGPGPVLNDGTCYVVAETGEEAFELLALA